jgi:hypothetical protein
MARGGPGDEDDEDAPEAEAIVDAEGFAAMAEEELAWYREAYSGLAATVHIRSDVAGVLVSDGDLLIGPSSGPPRRVPGRSSSMRSERMSSATPTAWRNR